MTTARTSFGGIVLSGGGGVRLGGVDKGGIEAGGRSLLERAVDALLDADDVVVVGPDVPLERPVTFRREEPRGSGPAAGIVAGLTGFVRLPDYVAVLAVDMPYVNPATFRRLRAAATGDGAVLVDQAGQQQFLCAVYRSALLHAAGAGGAFGLSMRALVNGFDLAEVAAVGDEAHDIDTWEDIDELRARENARADRVLRPD